MSIGLLKRLLRGGGKGPVNVPGVGKRARSTVQGYVNNPTRYAAAKKKARGFKGRHAGSAKSALQKSRRSMAADNARSGATFTSSRANHSPKVKAKLEKNRTDAIKRVQKKSKKAAKKAAKNSAKAKKASRERIEASEARIAVARTKAAKMKPGKAKDAAKERIEAMVGRIKLARARHNAKYGTK